jgi:hypothetical protein
LQTSIREPANENEAKATTEIFSNCSLSDEESFMQQVNNSFLLFMSFDALIMFS